MTSKTYPSPSYNSGNLADDEYENWAVDGAMPNGLVGKPTDPVLVYGDSSGRHVTFRASRSAFVRGRRWVNDSSPVTVNVAANAGATRYDLATLRLDRTGQTIVETVIQGTSGGGVPSPVHQAPGSGVWDLQCASIRVKTGVTVIDAVDVTPLAWYIGPQLIVCTSATRPYAIPGQQIFQTDDGGEYMANGSTWSTRYKDFGDVPLPNKGGSGWDITGSYIHYLNGVVFVRLTMVRTGADLPRSTLSVVASVSSVYWPTAVGDPPRVLGYYLDSDDIVDDPKHDVVDNSNGGILAEGYVSPQGNVTVYSNTKISQGDTVRFETLCYPAG